jgi:hypothetical protein
MKINYAAVTIAISALGAIAIVAPSVLQAQAQEKTSGAAVTQVEKGRAVPIRQIGEFDKVFTAKLNQLISESGTAAAKGTRRFTEHCGPDWCTKHWTTSETAREMSREELVKLRNQVGAELKIAARKKVDLSQVANGKISAGFFVGTVHKIGKPVE